MNRAGRAGRDELQVDAPAEQVGMAVAGARRHHVGDDGPRAEVVIRRLTQPGPATSAEPMPSAAISASASQPGPARAGSRLPLGHLQRQAGGVVAVLGVPWALHSDLGRQRTRIEPPRAEHPAAVLRSRAATGGGSWGSSHALRCVSPTAQHVRPRSSGDRSVCLRSRRPWFAAGGTISPAQTLSRARFVQLRFLPGSQPEEHET